MIPVARRPRKGALAALPVAACLVIAACSSGGSPSSAPTNSSSGSGGSGAVPSISATGLTNNFSAMTALKPLAAEGRGNVAVILPDTVTSTRYTEFDAPYLMRALSQAGLTASQFSVQNAQGSDATEFTEAQAAITKGASVLVVDPLDSNVGARIESAAKAAGVAVIDYDRLTLGGNRSYYVSFDNVKVGVLIGQGMQTCATNWHVSKPNVLVMKGSPTDNNATLFAQGYLSVLNPLFSGSDWVNVGEPPGTWDPPTAETEFQQAFTAHKNINAVLVPNDENAAPIITYLQRLRVKAQTFPVTGQDATLVGLQNVLAGYQCGTVYKPIFEEAQAAAALAMYMRAGKTPPSTLVNNTTTDSSTGTHVPSVLLIPEWVTSANMNSTVIADQFVPAQQLCTGAYTATCTAAGISV